jgi:hypothetical protein
VLPLLRRTFGAFETGERRAIGERIAAGGSAAAADQGAADFDHDRAASVLPTLARLLGRQEGP